MSLIRGQRTATQLLQQEFQEPVQRYNTSQQQILEKYDNKLIQLSEFFHELDDIYEDRDKYLLHWAFRNASQKMNEKLQQMENKSQSGLQMQSNWNDPLTEARINEYGESIKRDIKQASNRYEFLSRLTSTLDIVISVLLILGVTLIASHIESFLESYLILTGFIGAIALTKVSLDRFYIIPTIDEWGWNKYHDLTHAIEAKTTKIIAYKMSLELESQENFDYITPKWMKHHYY